MKGVTCITDEDIYLLEFDSYYSLVEYVHLKRPSQLSISFDGEKLTGSIPVAAYSVNEKSWN
jgi:hypothetical protein